MYIFMEEPTQTFTSSLSDKGKRLDKFLSDNTEISRSRVKVLIEDGYVTKDDKVITDAKYKVKPDETFSMQIPPAEPSDILPNHDIKLDIKYEDDEFLIINKQAGLTVHPGAGNYNETMVNALMAYCGDNLSGVGGVARPGIVHRLDKDTSGLILVAKTDNAHNKLSKQISERTAKRVYTAFCWGVPKPYSGTIETYIDRNPKHRLKMTTTEDKGKHAVTHYEVKKIYGQSIASKIECRLQTGRTHQIRVHFTDKGHPLIGDPLYGNKNNNKMKALSEDLYRFLQSFNRQALHSSQVGVEHPSNNNYINIVCDLPNDMKELENLLNDLK
ncbi:MAG: RNA pseudouridine synthase [Alphaproteobacteria bacterium CG11_big_fil_rev_8_21_14_0_20_39_49]|nr:MAG: RNA pseudouridine synthase [Alphaproteobacteria bacterium CG11_big_fil_rev_8_21_14_0_20_39_49]